MDFSSDPTLRDFLGMLGHDLRAPLSGLMGFLDLLEKTKLDETQRNCLSTAMFCGEDLLEMLNGILDGVRADTGKLVLNEEWNDLREMIRGVARIFEPQAALHEIRFEWNVNPDVPRWWHFDRWKLRQVLSNLLGNALKFTESGAISLTAEIGPGETHPLLWIKVRDTGCGIPSGHLDRIFEEFCQAGGNGRRQVAGYGLGLAIVRRLVRILGGAVKVRCAESLGTEVSLRFPWLHRQ